MGSLVVSSYASYQSLHDAYPKDIVAQADECSFCYEPLEEGPESHKSDTILEGHIVGKAWHVFHRECMKLILPTGDGECPICRAALLRLASLKTSVIIPFQFQLFKEIEQQCAAAVADACALCKDPLDQGPKGEASNTRLLGHVARITVHVFHESCMLKALADKEECHVCREHLELTDSSLQQRVRAYQAPIPEETPEPADIHPEAPIYIPNEVDEPVVLPPETLAWLNDWNVHDDLVGNPHHPPTTIVDEALEFFGEYMSTITPWAVVAAVAMGVLTGIALLSEGVALIDVLVVTVVVMVACFAFTIGFAIVVIVAIGLVFAAVCGVVIGVRWAGRRIEQLLA